MQHKRKKQLNYNDDKCDNNATIHAIIMRLVSALHTKMALGQ